MSSYSLYLPNYTVGADAYKAVPHVCRRFGKTAVVIGGKTAMSKAKEALEDGVKGSNLTITDYIWFGGDATYENVETLKNNPTVQAADMIFAVGGGRVCDTCKTLAAKMDKALFTFPTIASNCAPVTAICVMYKEDGSLSNYYFIPGPALHTFINTQIIAEAPGHFLWAGIGDALSKEYEVEFATRGMELKHTPLMGASLASACATPLYSYSAKALEDCKKNVASFELEQVALDIIISTGLVSNFATGMPEYYSNSNIAHCVYNGSTKIPACAEHHSHGEVVSYGVMCLAAYADNQALLEKVCKFNMSLGLPICLADIDLTENDVQIIADSVPSLTDWKAIPHQDGDQEKFAKAVLAADKFGKSMKK